MGIAKSAFRFSTGAILCRETGYVDPGTRWVPVEPGFSVLGSRSLALSLDWSTELANMP